MTKSSEEIGYHLKFMKKISYTETIQRNGYNDYYTVVKNLLSNRKKFKQILDDTTPSHRTSVQIHFETFSQNYRYTQSVELSKNTEIRDIT